MGDEDLSLDQNLRTWVVLPLTLVIFLMMLIRQYATQVRHAYEKVPVHFVLGEQCLLRRWSGW